ATPGSLSHQRTRGATATTATTEKRNDLAFEAGAAHKIASQRGEVAERIVRVRIIHDHREGLAAIHALEAAGNAGEIEDSFCDRLGGTIAGVTGGRGCEHVVHVHIADQ